MASKAAVKEAKKREQEKKKAEKFEKDQETLKRELEWFCPIGSLPDADKVQEPVSRQTHGASASMTAVRELLMKCCSLEDEDDGLAYQLGMALFGCSKSEKSMNTQSGSSTYATGGSSATIHHKTATYFLSKAEIDDLGKIYKKAAVKADGFVDSLKEIVTSTIHSDFAKLYVFTATFFGYCKFLVTHKVDVRNMHDARKKLIFFLEFGFNGIFNGLYSAEFLNKVLPKKEKIPIKGTTRQWIPSYAIQELQPEEEKILDVTGIAIAPHLFNCVELLGLPKKRTLTKKTKDGKEVKEEKIEVDATIPRKVALDMAKSTTLLMNYVLNKTEVFYNPCKNAFDLLEHDDLHDAIKKYLTPEGATEEAHHADLCKKFVVNRYKLYRMVTVLIKDLKEFFGKNNAEKIAGQKRNADTLAGDPNEIPGSSVAKKPNLSNDNPRKDNKTKQNDAEGKDGSSRHKPRRKRKGEDEAEMAEDDDANESSEEEEVKNKSDDGSQKENELEGERGGQVEIPKADKKAKTPDRKTSKEETPDKAIPSDHDKTSRPSAPPNTPEEQYALFKQLQEAGELTNAGICTNHCEQKNFNPSVVCKNGLECKHHVEYGKSFGFFHPPCVGNGDPEYKKCPFCLKGGQKALEKDAV